VRRLLALLGLAAPLLTLPALAGCSSGGNEAEVVATTTQVADLARNVAGDRLEVHAILRPNADPHEYEPRPSDARALGSAKLVLRSGGDVDGWLGDLIGEAGGGARVVTLEDAVRRWGEDPHWWQDPRNAILAVEAIRRALTRADPGGRAAYRRNAAAYVGRLRRLDRGIERCIGEIPPARRKLVTTHDALGYYAHRYGLEIVGALIPSLSTQAQPSARDTQRLVEQIRRERVPAIFPESSLNPKLERAVSREAHARVAGALWADTLGPPGSSGATYLRSMASNTETIVDGLRARRCRPDTRPAG
jgi:ABC-type Zn uptake system ZnuABC Zn-binding protein ZnuA